MSIFYHTETLSNGLRIIHLPTESPVAYCGYAVNVGTRDEEEDEFGMAHFVEHLLFKGTKHRSSWHILNRMEVVGGELNAYTSKEETFIYSTFLETHVERAIELLSDLVFHSTFPQSEIEKEVEVILDEINSYKDNPSELIYDEFENMMFAHHDLGHNILGVAEHLEQFDTAKGVAFMAKHYTPDNMVFFSMGKTDFRKIKRLVEKYAGEISTKVVQKPRIAPVVAPGKTIIEEKETHQSHVIIGVPAYSLHDENRLSLYMINNILGGPGMNSKLNLALRERHGYVYSVESNLTSYSDTGVLAIYFGSDPKNREKCIHLIHKEISGLRDRAFTDKQLSAAKKQIMGQMGVSVDNKESMVLAMGKSFLHFNRFDSLDQVYKRLENISSSQILSVSNEILDASKLYTLIYK